MLKHKVCDEGKTGATFKKPWRCGFILMSPLVRKTASKLFPFVNSALAAPAVCLMPRCFDAEHLLAYCETQMK